MTANGTSEAQVGIFPCSQLNFLCRGKRRKKTENCAPRRAAAAHSLSKMMTCVLITAVNVEQHHLSCHRQPWSVSVTTAGFTLRFPHSLSPIVVLNRHRPRSLLPTVTFCLCQLCFCRFWPNSLPQPIFGRRSYTPPSPVWIFDVTSLFFATKGLTPLLVTADLGLCLVVRSFLRSLLSRPISPLLLVFPLQLPISLFTTTSHKFCSPPAAQHSASAALVFWYCLSCLLLLSPLTLVSAVCGLGLCRGWPFSLMLVV